jgi:hypothetical protein
MEWRAALDASFYEESFSKLKYAIFDPLSVFDM